MRRVRLAAAAAALAPRPGAPLDQRGSWSGDSQLALPLEPQTEIPELPEQSAWERMLADYRLTLALGRHRTRSTSCDRICRPAWSPRLELDGAEDGAEVSVAGLVVARQRPATANGVVFMLLEDEHAQVNLIVPPPVYERFRAAVRGEPLLLARGRYEVNGRNRNVVVFELTSLGPFARRAANDAEVRSSLPSAHSFGRR